MANLNSVLNERIARIARKQIKAEISTARRLTVQHRRDIAALKRQIAALQKSMSRMERSERRQSGRTPEVASPREGLRFRADGLRSHRKRLGLSAEDYGRLIGASALSVYHWEAGKSKPRGQSVAKLASVRGMGKRDVQKRLDQLKDARSAA